jgi:hypothetical protein
MEAASEDDAVRLRFFDHLTGAELFLLLEAEASGPEVAPRSFTVDGSRYVLAFDTEERLAAFVGATAPYASLTGRSLAPLLESKGLGLALNPEVAPSTVFLPPEAVAWLAAAIAERPAEVEARPTHVGPPVGLPDALLEALDAKLATAVGVAGHALLVAVSYQDGREGHLLAFVDAVPGAEPDLARAAGEALRFSGVEAGELDVSFFRSADPALGRLARVGLRFDVPQPSSPDVPRGPGLDPDRPPRLR